MVKIIADDQHFLHFPQCFQKDYFCESLKFKTVRLSVKEGERRTQFYQELGNDSYTHIYILCLHFSQLLSQWYHDFINNSFM